MNCGSEKQKQWKIYEEPYNQNELFPVNGRPIENAKPLLKTNNWGSKGIFHSIAMEKAKK